MAFVSDTFTDTDGTLLQNHTPETGGAWSRTIGRTDATTQGNRARLPAAATEDVVYENAGTPDSAEYVVESKVIAPANDLADIKLGIVGRKQSGADTYYRAYLQGGADGARKLILNKVVSGTVTQLGSYLFDWAVSTLYTIRLEIRDAEKKVFLDGVERISSTDNAITGAGKSGLYGRTTTGSVRQWDDFSSANIINELGKSFTSTSVITKTDSVTRGELNKSIAISSALGETNIVQFNELNRFFSTVGLISETDARIYTETLREFTANAIINSADFVTFSELSKQMTITTDIKTFQGSFIMPANNPGEFTSISSNTGEFTPISSNTGDFVKTN